MPNPTATTAPHTRAHRAHTQPPAITRTHTYTNTSGVLNFPLSPRCVRAMCFYISRQPPPPPPSPSSLLLYARPLRHFHALVCRIKCGKSGACVREIPNQKENMESYGNFPIFHRAIRDTTAGANTMLPFSLLLHIESAGCSSNLTPTLLWQSLSF